MLGEIIKQRYQVVQILSSSSYCQTYLARDVNQNQLTACVIKHLLPAENQNTGSLSTLRRLFIREVAALEKLGTYPQVPQLLDHFEENQQFYLVLEYVAGQPLSTLMPPGSRWSEKQTVELLYEVLSILEVVHAHGLIHRDIKPSNLIQRASDGLLVLIDFGSVKQAWTQVVTSHGQTNANYAIGIPATVAIGTPGYMPSEQSRGRPRPNSDIYALGMIGIQALTGMQPTLLLEDAETGEVMWQNLAVVSPELAVILNQMVRYHFSERYQTATEVLAALQPIVAKLAPHKLDVAESIEPSPSKPSGSLATKTTTTRSQRHQNLALWLGIALGVMSAMTLILVVYYYILRPAPKSSAMSTPQLALLANSDATNAKGFRAQTLLGHTNSVWAIAINGDGRILASGSEDRTIKVWDLATGQLLRSLLGHTDTVRAIAIDPNGSTLASGSGDKNIRLWNWQTGKQLGTLRGNTGPIWSIAISRDSQTLVSGGEDGTVRLWNFQTGELLHAISAHTGRVFSVALSPNGQICATAGIDRTIKIWNLQGQLLHVLKGHTDVVRAVNFSPDGQKLASSSWDKTVKIWNWQTEKQLYTLKGHTARVISVAFSSDGTIASASNDRTIKIWNVQAGKLLQTLLDHQDWVLAVVSSPNQTFVSSSKDKTIKVWQQ